MANDGEKTFVIRQIAYAKEWLERALGHYEESEEAQGFVDLTIAEAEIRSAREKSAGLEKEEARPAALKSQQRMRIAQVSVASILVVGFFAGLVYNKIENMQVPRISDFGTVEVRDTLPPVEIASSPAPVVVEIEPEIEAPATEADVEFMEPAETVAPVVAEPFVAPVIRPVRAYVAPPQPAIVAPEVAAEPPAPVVVKIEPAIEPVVPAYKTSILSLEEYSALKEAALKARDNID